MTRLHLWMGNRPDPPAFQWGVGIGSGLVRAHRGRRALVLGAVVAALSAALAVLPTDHGEALPEVAPVEMPIALSPAVRVQPPSLSWQTVRVGTVTRRYLLELPARRTARPLVIVFHGLWQHPGTFGAKTGLVADAAAEGVVLAIPDAQAGAFNDGRLGSHGPDDDAFFVALRAQLVDRGLVDPHRVTVAGFSNGADMAMEIASRHPHLIAALVSVCGELLAAPGSARPHTPVTTVLIHGNRDRLQPWGGRRRWGRWLVASVSVPRTVHSFVGALGRHGAPVVAAVAGAPRVGGRAGITVTTWRGPDGHSVIFYALAGFGHAWPVRHSTPHAPLRGRIVASSSIDATAITLATALSVRSR